MMSICGCRWRCSVFVIVGVVLALLASGCMWGVVRDADTGAPIAGAEVHFIDSEFNSRVATTDAVGAFVFNPGSEPGPVAGPVNFAVGAPGYETLGDQRVADFTGTCLPDLTNSCDMQTFGIAPRPGVYHNVAKGFSMRFPSGWEIWPGDEFSPESGLWDVWAGGDVGSLDLFFTCGVASGDLAAGEAPEAWWDLKTELSGGRKAAARLGGVGAIRITYTGGSGSDAIVVYLARRAGKAWALACYSDPAYLPQSMSVFQDIEQSFKFDK